MATELEIKEAVCPSSPSAGFGKCPQIIPRNLPSSVSLPPRQVADVIWPHRVEAVQVVVNTSRRDIQESRCFGHGRQFVHGCQSQFLFLPLRHRRRIPRIGLNPLTR